MNEERENQFDLLTAALIGVAIGAGVTLMVRRGPSGSRPLRPMLRAAGKARALPASTDLKAHAGPGTAQPAVHAGPARARHRE